jgi:hypothetical protein
MRSVIAVIVLAGCGSPTDRKDPDKYEFDLRLGKHSNDPGRYAQPEAQSPQQLVKPDVDPTPSVPAPKPRVDPSCMASGTVQQIRSTGDKVYACVDTTSDGQADACASWSRATGKFIEVAPIFAVEDDTTKDTPAVEPVDLDADDPRVTTDSDSVSACPEDRACLKFMPRIKDGDTLELARSDANHRAAAVVISEGDSRSARLELWDLEAGRLRTRAHLVGPDKDETYTIAVRAYGDSFVTMQKRSADDRAVVTLFSLDGTRRVALGGGSTFIDTAQLIENAPGQLAVLDIAPVGKPYNIYIHAVPSGATIGKFTIPAQGDDDSVSLVKMDHGMIGVTQWKADTGNNDGHLRVDVIDPKASSSRTFTAPGC